MKIIANIGKRVGKALRHGKAGGNGAPGELRLQGSHYAPRSLAYIFGQRRATEEF